MCKNTHSQFLIAKKSYATRNRIKIKLKSILKDCLYKQKHIYFNYILNLLYTKNHNRFNE